MKLKVTILFIIISAVFIFLVFKGNYFSAIKGIDNSNVKEVLNSGAILSELNTTNLRDYRGNKISIDKNVLLGHEDVIIHLWASWCGPCVNEVPELIEFSKLNPKVIFIIVSLDENQKDIETFLKSFPQFNADKFVRIWDNSDTISKYLNADRLPMSVILRKDKSEPQIVRSVVDWKRLVL